MPPLYEHSRPGRRNAPSLARAGRTQCRAGRARSRSCGTPHRASQDAAYTLSTRRHKARGRVSAHLREPTKAERWRSLWIVRLLDHTPEVAARRAEGRIGERLKPTGNRRLPRAWGPQRPRSPTSRCRPSPGRSSSRVRAAQGKRSRPEGYADGLLDTHNANRNLTATCTWQRPLGLAEPFSRPDASYVRVGVRST